MPLKWERIKKEGLLEWSSGPYRIIRVPSRDSSGKHYSYMAGLQGGELLHKDPLIDYGDNEPLKEAKRLCEQHAQLAKIRSNDER